MQNDPSFFGGCMIRTIDTSGNMWVRRKSEEDRERTKTIGKTNSLFGFTSLGEVYQTALKYFAPMIRDRLFFPLNSNLDIQMQTMKEMQFVKKVWEGSIETELEHMTQVRNTFEPTTQTIGITHENKTIQISVEIIQSKQLDQNPTYNFLIVPGNRTREGSDIAHVHPFLNSFIEHTVGRPQARFISITQYDMKCEGEVYKPASLDESGQILAKAISCLIKEFGPIDQLFAHSLGSIQLCASLKHLTQMPISIHLHCAPSSIRAVVQHMWGGRVIHHIAAKAGWSLDAEAEIGRFLHSRPDFPLVVSGVEHDHYFSGSANLCESGELQKLGVTLLKYSPFHQVVHPTAHHNLPCGQLLPYQLSKPNAYINGNESLASAVVRHSLGRRTISQAV